jgi:hypothetical protein
MKYAHSTISWPMISRAITSVPSVMTTSSGLVPPPPCIWSRYGFSSLLNASPNGVASIRKTMAEN